MTDAVYPWRVSCPICATQVTMRPRAVLGWEQDLQMITCQIEFLGPHSCNKPPKETST